MYKILFASIIFSLFALHSSGQDIDSLKLNALEIPDGYLRAQELNCKSIQAALLYENPGLYEMLLGKVSRKDFQSFEKKGDKGSILYLQFDQDISGSSFIKGLLWGESDKPTKAHPEEYVIKGQLLIIWSLDKDSEIKKISKNKIDKFLQ